VDLERRFGPSAGSCWPPVWLGKRKFDAGERPDFLPETAEVRKANWTVAPLPRIY